MLPTRSGNPSKRDHEPTGCDAASVPAFTYSSRGTFGAARARVGGGDFAQLAVVLREATDEAAAVTINYRAFLQAIIDFLIIALVIFVAVKVISNMNRKEGEKPSEPPKPNEELALLRGDPYLVEPDLIEPSIRLACGRRVRDVLTSARISR